MAEKKQKPAPKPKAAAKPKAETKAARAAGSTPAERAGGPGGAVQHPRKRDARRR
jgi:hypothetical protein